jgi:hypothetical protein
MSQSTTASATKPEVRPNTTQTPQEVSAQPAPVLISEQEVLFGTRVAASPHKASIPRRWFDAVRGAAHSLQLPPPHPHYPADMGYLERSRMAREMDRL